MEIAFQAGLRSMLFTNILSKQPKDSATLSYLFFFFLQITENYFFCQEGPRKKNKLNFITVSKYINVSWWQLQMIVKVRSPQVYFCNL